MKRVFSILLFVSAFGLILAGCGKSDETSPEGTTGAATGATTGSTAGAKTEGDGG